jgi:hypothetical protein
METVVVEQQNGRERLDGAARRQIQVLSRPSLFPSALITFPPNLSDGAL